jgi:Peptidase family M1 domain
MKTHWWLSGAVVCLALAATRTFSAFAETSTSPGMHLYQELRQFDLSGGISHAENLTLKRDRVTMTFNGTFYFEKPIDQHVYGAVFVGEGTFHADPPPTDFERENVRRLLNDDAVDSDFRTAVLRFSDSTFDEIAGHVSQGEAEREARRLADEFEPRLLKEVGANMSARLSISILNGEQPGVFVAQFDKGKRGAFTYALDFQSRIPLASFDLDAGEKGVIFAHNFALYNEVWMAFYSLDDYEHGRVQYSDSFDLVAIPKYTMNIDVTDPGKLLSEQVRIDMTLLSGGVRAIPLMLNNSLGEGGSERLKKAMRLDPAKLVGGGTIEAVQEDWEGGITLFLPDPRNGGESFGVELALQGKPMYHLDLTGQDLIEACYYPVATTDWYPRHSALKRSAYDLVFRHKRHDLVAAVGHRLWEDPAPDGKSEMITEWRMDSPVALVTFAVGPFKRYSESEKRQEGDIPIEFFEPSGSGKADFIVAELGNSLRYFSTLFGTYPYSNFGAVLHPRPFGQGFPTLLLLARSDMATSQDFSFIAHETSHQWWGDVVSWRSYRDQWLSEGFAEYSGILYTAAREDKKSSQELIERSRKSLLNPPVTDVGVLKGRLEDIGPLVLGHRLSTRATQGAYTTLIYQKGAMVLRMLHFLFSDINTGNDQPFFDMMKSFVGRYAGGSASTSDFIASANQRFPDTPIGKSFKMTDLNWFFRQWVYKTGLPSYELQYKLLPQPDGSMLVDGTLYQNDVPDNWLMPLPLVFEFAKGRPARGMVWAHGPQAPIKLKIPAQPSKVELDPDHWILSAKTSTSRIR